MRFSHGGCIIYSEVNEMFDFGNAGIWTKELLTQRLSAGDFAVDATMGNGHDTLFLARLVGSAGHVWAFDIQPAALDNTRTRLEQAGLDDSVSLFLADHARMDEFVPFPVDAVVFNLGWLPGQAHDVTTRADSTVKALNAALRLLKTGGLLTVCVYPGHEEGIKELEAVSVWARTLDDKKYDAVSRGYENIGARPPRLFAVVKKQ